MTGSKIEQNQGTGEHGMFPNSRDSPSAGTPSPAVAQSELSAAQQPRSEGARLLDSLIEQSATTSARPSSGLTIGRLLALADEGRVPLVWYPGQPTDAGMRARSAVDLHGAHIGQDVVLGFEHQDPTLPIVLGLLQGQAGWPLPTMPRQVTVEADGQRMLVTAQQELVLRCGKSSISLRADGRVEIRGVTVSTEATAANHIRGGSVELN